MYRIILDHVPWWTPSKFPRKNTGAPGAPRCVSHVRGHVHVAVDVRVWWLGTARRRATSPLILGWFWNGAADIFWDFDGYFQYIQWIIIYIYYYIIYYIYIYFIYIFEGYSKMAWRKIIHWRYWTLWFSNYKPLFSSRIFHCHVWLTDGIQAGKSANDIGVCPLLRLICGWWHDLPWPSIISCCKKPQGKYFRMEMAHLRIVPWLTQFSDDFLVQVLGIFHRCPSHDGMDYPAW